jgi:glycosyltransferase involved in cell wall biosynthesis
MHKDNFIVSVILTTYNRSHLLLNAVNSVLKGSYKNIELIIVNDCSPDNTDEVVNQIDDKRIKYIKLNKNSGVLAARNRGFDASSGDIIAILDDDDILIPDALEKIVAEFSQIDPKERGILWFDCVDKESGKKSGIMPIKEGAVSFEDYVCGRIKGDFWLVFAKHVLEKHRFDERLRAHESLFWLKLHRIYPAKYIPLVVCAKFREHGERLCDLKVRMAQLPQTTLALSEYYKQFGQDVKQLCPVVYGEKLAYLGLHQLMMGEFKLGRKSIMTSLRFRFSIKYLILYGISFFSWTEMIKKMYKMSERMT